MQVKEIMTPNPACCTPDTMLQRVAEMMVEHIPRGGGFGRRQARPVRLEP